MANKLIRWTTCHIWDTVINKSLLFALVINFGLIVFRAQFSKNKLVIFINRPLHWVCANKRLPLMIHLIANECAHKPHDYFLANNAIKSRALMLMIDNLSFGSRSESDQSVEKCDREIPIGWNHPCHQMCFFAHKIRKANVSTRIVVEK